MTARAAATGSCAGGGASCSSSPSATGRAASTSSEHLVIVAPADDDPAGLLQAPDDGDDLALRLLDDSALLGGHVLHLLGEHLAAALGHVPEDPVLDVLADAAQGDPELLGVDLLEHELDRAVVELDDVLEREEQHPHLL